MTKSQAANRGKTFLWTLFQGLEYHGMGDSWTLIGGKAMDPIPWYMCCTSIMEKWKEDATTLVLPYFYSSSYQRYQGVKAEKDWGLIPVKTPQNV